MYLVRGMRWLRVALHGIWRLSISARALWRKLTKLLSTTAASMREKSKTLGAGTAAKTRGRWAAESSIGGIAQRRQQRWPQLVRRRGRMVASASS
jgi:hypothetical protein